MTSLLELIATFSGFIYVILIIVKKPIGWLFGILSSFFLVKVSLDAHLYVQTILQFIYVIIGVFGYFQWKKKNSTAKVLSRFWKTLMYISAILISLALGYAISFTRQSMPYIDSFVSIFGILATYLTSEKQIENWVIWIIVNLLSIFLFMQQKLYISASLFGIYLLLSVIGLVSWNKQKSREKIF